jgi:hypothetical protein
VPRAQSKTLPRPCTPQELLAIDLYDRPFLHEQGNTVTRGFVRFFEVSGDHWQLHLHSIEIFNKSNLRWEPDCDEDTYGGTLDFLRISRLFGGHHAIFDIGIEIDGYAMTIFIGKASTDPWFDNDWPQLDTELLPPGPMR